MLTRKFHFDNNQGIFSFSAPFLIAFVYCPPARDPIPRQAIECGFYLDTGADEIGIIPQQIIIGFGVAQRGIIGVRDYYGNTVDRPTYSVSLKIEKINFNKTVEVIAAPKEYGLIPRKLLNEWRVNLNGPKEIFHITAY